MSIFQKSIVDKYLATLDSDLIDNAYQSYKEVYSEQKIKRIKNLKEEQYQDGFLKDIFGSVLGYTIDPELGYNIELEKKNETNSKKADGAIVKEEKVLGVIELKSNSTKNLESIKDQAFGYKNNHKGCKYVISSNFHKLRFYVDDATEYEEFDLYNLDKETFKKFYLFLRKEGLLDKNVPKLLKEETRFHEENISKQLYKDYSVFKNKFFENIVKNNPQHDKLLLFKKSQKFLDRILFILFAEDKELIPVNAISRIVESWVLADDLHYKPLYELFTILFEHLNVGHTYKSGYEIPAYNGGLFSPDEILDNLKVDDEILKDDLLILSKYDFNTDVDVNILGHIFEHSLSEIEEIEAELRGEESNKSKGKRKKDGVFYTPKYITKYIVDNTVRKLCSSKKKELGLDVDIVVKDYQKSNGSVNAKGKELFKILEFYKAWLLQLKILDPACGSGAFLNQALTFLIEEHKNIDDLIAELTNTPLRIFDIDKSILENNIFGVDINEESVEIAKLSLWLRTAQKGRKLSNLNNNIKCGNSLIDDTDIAGDKAFNWNREFPEIFENGGFDIVIGNPPWVSLIGKHGQNITKQTLDYLTNRYKGNTYMPNLFEYFIRLSLEITNKGGINSLIVPDRFGLNEVFSNLRADLLNTSKIIEIIYKWDFPGIVTDTMTYVLEKNTIEEDYEFKIKNRPSSNFVKFNKSEINCTKSCEFKPYDNEKTKNLLDKLLSNKVLKDYYKSTSGFGGKSNLITNDRLNNNQIQILKGRSIGRYMTKESLFFEFNDENVTGRTRDKEKLGKEIKILLRKTGSSIVATFDNTKIFPEQSLYFIYEFKNSNEAKNILALFNSKLYSWIYIKNFVTNLDSTPQLKNVDLYKFPIRFFNVEKSKFIVQSVDSLISNNEKIVLLTNKFIELLQSDFSIIKKSKKIENWYTLEWSEFEQELKKNKITLSGTLKDDWYDRFKKLKQEAQYLKAEIDKSDYEINQNVYNLFELTENEIKFIEEY